MKIIEPSVELIDQVNAQEIYSKIERCGRVCHQSQPKAGETANFVRMLIKRGHESVLEHVSLTFHIICDRAIQNELVRQRIASFSVESTRWVKYDEIEVIAPGFGEEEPRDTEYEKVYDDEEETVFEETPTKFRAWEMAMLGVEQIYQFLLRQGARPEIARAVLPLCLKSELYMTANLREWRHILKLRTSKHAHPQMRFVAGQILDIFRDKLPVIVEDIKKPPEGGEFTTEQDCQCDPTDSPSKR